LEAFITPLRRRVSRRRVRLEIAPIVKEIIEILLIEPAELAGLMGEIFIDAHIGERRNFF
jgi:hypothetical protein